MKLSFISLTSIQNIRKNVSDQILQSQLLSDAFRVNALYSIRRAGSGHIGTSFSCMDIITWLFTQEMDHSKDLYFSSKGHDAPALYGLLTGLGKLDFEYIHKLRRLHGLPGHPDIHIPNMVTNTGSLGMGISKARGMVQAMRLAGKTGSVYVLTGDGELEEGQIWESLQPTANGKYGEITVIVDHNKLQSDIEVLHVSDLGDLEKKFTSFGWEVARCDGHDFEAFKNILERFKEINDKPKIIIADTIKGKGSSVTEATKHTNEDELYNFHAGAPSLENYQKIHLELLERINLQLSKLGLEKITCEEVEVEAPKAQNNPQKLIDAYEDELAVLGKKYQDIVVLDGDLMKDTGLISFKQQFPDRFIECGIAEQDMVSMAGGLALQGKLPIVHSFACFLSTRPNEQIYNNATEETKIIYTGSLSGLLPAGPGHSHQSVRDVSVLGSIPGLTLIEPSCEQETKMALCWAVEENKKSTYIRLVSIPIETSYKLPKHYKLEKGRGVQLIEGNDAVIFSYSPVMLTEAVLVAKILEEKGISLSVYNLPWLNHVDRQWLNDVTRDVKIIFTLDNHYITFGQGNIIAAVLPREVISLGLSRVPGCGENKEVLKFHNLDAQSIAKIIYNTVTGENNLESGSSVKF